MSKKFNRIVLLGTLVFLILIASITIVIDPYFHYHTPLEFLKYPLNMDTERYQNNGIIRNFSYDAMITGTSMTENFKTSEMDELFGVHSIKAPCSGSSYKEIDSMVSTALKTHPDIKIIVRCLDYSLLIQDKNYSYENEERYPAYMVDNNIFNDVSYVLNKSIICTADVNVLLNTISGGDSVNFDAYGNWSKTSGFGKQAVFSTFQRPSEVHEEQTLTEEEKEMVLGNVEQNVIANIKAHPNTQFYLYVPQYSVCYWDQLIRNGQFDAMLEAESLQVNELLKYDNVHLFLFSNDFEITTNLDNYRDEVHYGEWVNSRVLQCMKNGEFEITKENYAAYQKEVRDFYSNYDYDVIYK